MHDAEPAFFNRRDAMFEAHYSPDAIAWFVREHYGDNRVRYLAKDGTVMAWASGNSTLASTLESILADPTSAYYPTQAAALAAIHAHYHDDDTVTIEPGDIPARLEVE
jgi:hypothetical protein